MASLKYNEEAKTNQNYTLLNQFRNKIHFFICLLVSTIESIT